MIPAGVAVMALFGPFAVLGWVAAGTGPFIWKIAKERGHEQGDSRLGQDRMDEAFKRYLREVKRSEDD